MNNKYDGFVCLLGIGIGLVGVGYAIGTRSKMARISENLNRSIDELASQMPVDIPNDMIQRATEKAVAYEVKKTVGKATDGIMVEIKRDIHKQVSDAVESEYSNVKGTVLDELVNAASKIDVGRVRSDVEKAAKEHALQKFDANLDGILENFNDQLKNTSKIYTSIADSMTGYKSNNSETILRIGR
jgi:hypothetical protein